MLNCHKWFVTRSKIHPLVLYMAYGGWLSKTISIFRKKKFHFISINFFVCYNCSINLKRQSEHSGLCLDTSSLFSTFVTIVSECLCSGWVFFLQTKFGFWTSHFCRKFLISVWKDFLPVICFVMLWRFKDCHFGQFRTVIKRYILRYYCISGDWIRLRNCSKLVEKNTSVISDLLQGAKFILLYFIWRMGGWLSKTISIFRKKNFILFQ